MNNETPESGTYLYYVSALITQPHEGAAAMSTHLVSRDGPANTEKSIGEIRDFLEEQNPHLGTGMVIISVVRLDGDEQP